MSDSRRSATLLALSMLALAGVAPAQAPAAARESPAAGAVERVWQDPRFQREFLGTYGTDAEVEPGFSEAEKERMREILPLLEANRLAEAAEALETLIAPPADPAGDEGEKRRRRRSRADGDAAAALEEVGPAVHFTLGNVYMQLERLDEARAQYEIAIEKFSSFRRAHRNLGAIHARQNRADEAIRHLTRVIELGGADGATFGLLGFAYFASGQHVAAESAYRQAMLLQPEVDQWKLGLAHSVLEQGKYGETASLTDELLAKEPANRDFWLLQANAYIGMGQPLEAAKNYEFVMRLGGDIPLATMYTLGDVYVNQELWELAARSYARAIEQHPDQPVDEPLRRIEALATRGASEEARTLMNVVRERFGAQLVDEQRKKLLKLESRMAVAEGDGGAAVGVLEEIVALDPLDGEALILLGQHWADEDPDRAEMYYERAENIEGHRAAALVRHAQLLVEQSRFGEAVPLLEQAQQIEPRDDVARYLEQVERVARTTTR